MRNQSTTRNIDWILVLMYLVLVLMGWMNIYSATFNEQHPSIFDMDQNYGKQLIWIITAGLIITVIFIIDTKFYEAFAYFIYGAVILTLIAVIFIGKEVAGSRSWFVVGSFRIQPAEFGKFATCLALSKFLSIQDINILKLKNLMVCAMFIGVPSLLILLQNDTGSAMVYAIFLLLFYREGLPGIILVTVVYLALVFILALLKDTYLLISIYSIIAFLVILINKKNKTMIYRTLMVLAATIAISFSVSFVFYKILQPHQRNRIIVLFSPDIDPKGVGYNVNQAKIAIGSGGLIGKGFLQGTQTKYNFVPEQGTDFIFCTVGEEWGLAGSMVVIVLFVSLLVRIVYIAERQRSQFNRIYGYGVASVLFFHVMINIGMTIGLAPVIGIPLPFFSYGGSSLWSFTILLFIFVKIDSHRLQVLR